MTFKDQAAESAIVSNSLPSGQITPVKIQLNDTTLSHGSNKAYSDYSEPTILQSILSGGVGGALMVIVGHPLDLLKVRHQALPSSPAHGKNTGKGSSGLINMFLELKMIVKRQGYRGLYRGLLTPLCAVAPTFAVEYGAFELFQSSIRSQSGKTLKSVSSKSTDQKLSFWEVAAAGGLSAVPATLLVAPAERIKCLVQVSGESEKSQGSLRQAWKKADGIKGLYTGTLATLLRDSPGAAAYFTTYHVFKRLLTSESTPPSPFAIMFAGGLAGMANWVVAIPADVIKSRQQTASASEKLSFLETFRILFRTEGARGLFRGLTPALIRAFPANAACFLGIEASLSLMGVKSQDH
ncbi:hypothetical protein DSO57_1009532 [Entomophthora muscae]|uniref:Uncharacterized protein n=1 Tax=Entomophthora muscae TaxID=34485 RepID=A0ACC2RLU1_9FUNG|nr:hypothetical protein DSO57_1009532 [Entomophthora muscae]